MSMKQISFLSNDENSDDKYNGGNETPLYLPTGRMPHILELINKTKTNKLIKDIENTDLDHDVKEFLMYAAQRHLAFNYELIADYYSNSPIKIQKLMEESALVIVDFDGGIENGFIELTSKIRKIYLEEFKG